MLAKVDRLLDVLVPQRCLLCHEPRPGWRPFPAPGSLCPDCRTDLPWLALPGRGSPESGRVFAALSYEYPVDRLVTAAKFHRRRECARALGELLATALRSHQGATLPDLLVAVPLHRRRLGERGFNQAEDIAHEVSNALRIPQDVRLCLRERATAEQSGLSAAARRRNLRGAFRVTRDVCGATIAVIDDVITTGSTAATLVRALAAAGAAEVVVWAAAQTPVRAQSGRKV